jgi:queuine tRNA-ribosyltransferase
MPVGTRATVRGLDPQELEGAGATIVLANTYHLWVRPGHGRVAALGGLHKFMGWRGPILTDSGGYQVFSLSEHRKVTEEGVRFRSPEDGAYRQLTPEIAVEIQEALGVDIAMAFDECIEWPADRERVARSTERTTRWLRRCLEARRAPERTALFGIVQGGTYEDLRSEHAAILSEMPVDGCAIGGLSVGEGHDAMLQAVEAANRYLPASKVRYLMGVGQPVDIAEAVARGVDQFDCVLPSRAGRHGQAYTWSGRRNLKNARYQDDPGPLDPTCACGTCQRFSRAYLGHLTRCDELLGKRLLTLHNIHFYQDLMRRLRAAILTREPAALDAVRAAARVASGPAID